MLQRLHNLNNEKYIFVDIFHIPDKLRVRANKHFLKNLTTNDFSYNLYQTGKMLGADIYLFQSRR